MLKTDKFECLSTGLITYRWFKRPFSILCQWIFYCESAESATCCRSQQGEGHSKGLLWEYREVPLTALASVSPCHCTQPRHIRHLSHHYPLNTLGRAAAGLLLPLSATNGCGDGNKYS